MSKLAIQLSCYDGARYLPHILASLRAQTFRDWTLYVTDNASDPVQAEAVRAFARELGDRAVYVDVGPRNVDFAGAHNLLFSKHQAAYVMLHNDDAILEPAYLERLVAALDADARLGSVAGRVYRWDFDRAACVVPPCQGGTAQLSWAEGSGGRTDVIDSFGLAMSATGAVRDIGAGERVSTAQLHEGVHEAFGVSGCLPMYRRAAVEAASLDGNLFDPSFVSYKEDVELAWRLRRAGFASGVVSDAVAYHRRSFGTARIAPLPRGAACWPHFGRRGVCEAGRGGIGRTAQTWRPVFHSYRNHLWTLAMHFPLFSRGSQGEFRSAPARAWAVLPYEAAKAAYWLVMRPRVCTEAWRETWEHRHELITKRRAYAARFGAVRAVPSPADAARAQAPLPFSPPAASPQPPATYLDIAVVIVSHDDLSAACLRSLDRARKASGLRVGVVVVDNASTAYDAAAVLWDAIPDGVVVQRNWDAGYGSSVNRGAAELDAEFLFVLNPDTELVDDRLFAKLVAFMRAHPRAGIAAPKIVYPDGQAQETVRRFPSWPLPLVQRTTLGGTAFGRRYLHRFLMRDTPPGETRMVDWAQGSALFLPMEHWRALGGFDERFWMYFEDVDLCRRSWAMHRPVYYVADAALQHAYGKGSVRQGSLLRTLLVNRMARAHSISFLKYFAKWPDELFRTRVR